MSRYTQFRGTSSRPEAAYDERGHRLRGGGHTWPAGEDEAPVRLKCAAKKKEIKDEEPTAGPKNVPRCQTIIWGTPGSGKSAFISHGLGQLYNERAEIVRWQKELEERKTQIRRSAIKAALDELKGTCPPQVAIAAFRTVEPLHKHGFSRREFLSAARTLPAKRVLFSFDDERRLRFSSPNYDLACLDTGGGAIPAYYSPLERELQAIRAELAWGKSALRLLAHEIARELQRCRAQSRAPSIVVEQRPFFIQHSFHPPDAHLSAQRFVSGRMGLAA